MRLALPVFPLSPSWWGTIDGQTLTYCPLTLKQSVLNSDDKFGSKLATNLAKWYNFVDCGFCFRINSTDGNTHHDGVIAVKRLALQSLTRSVYTWHWNRCTLCSTATGVVYTLTQMRWTRLPISLLASHRMKQKISCLSINRISEFDDKSA